MYVSQVERPSAAAIRRVPGTVVALGVVSLLTDVSSEMVTAFLPLYLVYTLQVSYVQFGLLDGIYTGATAAMRIVGGHLSDRWNRPKLVASAGYGISAVTRIGLLLVGASGIGIGAMVATDRLGKGVRTAPRDALITASTAPDQLGRAFGVHRSLDTLGALLGPLVTFLILVWLGTGPEPVFVVSFGFALLGLIVMAGFVPSSRRAPRQAAGREAGDAQRPTLRAAFALLRDRPVRIAAILAAVLGLATLSDAFLFLLAQQATRMPVSLLPLLPLGTAAVFLLLAAPAGRFADRIGRRRLFLIGHVLLLGAYGVLFLGVGGPVALGVVLVLHGAFYACTDGVLSAWVAQLVPASLRASGLAVVQSAQALARFVSSVSVGILLTFATAHAAIAVATLSLTAALAAAVAIVRSGRPDSAEASGAGGVG